MVGGSKQVSEPTASATFRESHCADCVRHAPILVPVIVAPARVAPWLVRFAAPK